MRKNSILWATICTLPIVAIFPFVHWNFYDNPVIDVDRLYGCYGLQNTPLVDISSDKITDVQSKNSAKIVRIFLLKRWPVINTVRNISFILNRGLVVGNYTTGFFYEIRESEGRLELHLPDGAGGNVVMHKLSC